MMRVCSLRSQFREENNKYNNDNAIQTPSNNNNDSSLINSCLKTESGCLSIYCTYCLPFICLLLCCLGMGVSGWSG